MSTSQKEARKELVALSEMLEEAFENGSQRYAQFWAWLVVGEWSWGRISDADFRIIAEQILIAVESGRKAAYAKQTDEWVERTSALMSRKIN